MLTLTKLRLDDRASIKVLIIVVLDTSSLLIFFLGLLYYFKFHLQHLL